MTRRDFARRLLFGLIFVPALAVAPRALLWSLLFEPDAPLVPAKPLPSNPFMHEGKALVVMVHGRDPVPMLERALARLGGLDRLGLEGRRVLIKPNVVNNRPPPSTTSPAMLAAVLHRITRSGPSHVVVADSSGMLRFPTSENFEQTGLRRTALAAGAEVVALEDEPWVRIERGRDAIVPRFYVSKPVYEADVFINLPVVKTHQFAHYSCCLKNLVGIVHPRNRPSLRFLSGRWHEQIAELNTAVHPQLNIADATTMMIAGGPTSGTPAQANVILASGDRVALDAVALALIRSYGAWNKVAGGSVWEQRQIQHAARLGLGAAGAARMELIIDDLDGTDASFRRRAEEIQSDVRRI